MRKTDKVFVRIGFEDATVPIADAENEVDFPEQYFVGYEDEYGEECEEDGTYLNSDED
jgi:hypothetical protein